jgi:hypothetical protein
MGVTTAAVGTIKKKSFMGVFSPNPYVHSGIAFWTFYFW